MFSHHISTSTGSDTHLTTHTRLLSTQQKSKQEKSSLSLMLIILLYIFIICTEKEKTRSNPAMKQHRDEQAKGEGGEIEKERVY